MVEEFLVQREPGNCTLEEEVEQCRLGFDITSITCLDEAAPSPDLQSFVTEKRRTREHRRRHKRPPLITNCMVRFAPSPQGLTRIRSIKSGTLALETFLANEPQPPSALHALANTSARSTPIKWSLSAQAPIRVKMHATTPTPSTPRGAHRGRAHPIIYRPSIPTHAKRLLAHYHGGG